MQVENTSCDICFETHIQFSSPNQWRSDKVRTYALTSLKLSPNAIVCRLCRDDISKVLMNSSHVPRWTLRREKIINKCIVDKCNDDSFVSTKVCTADELRKVFDSVQLQCSVHIPTPTPLCKHHYHKVYNSLVPTQKNCTTCNISLKHSNSRPCPQPDVIMNHLRVHTSFNGNIKEHDKVCCACYRSQLFIIQKNSIISNDSDLEQLIKTYSSNSKVVVTIHDAVDYAVNEVTVMVAKQLLARNVLLLTNVHESFLNYVHEKIIKNNIQCTESETQVPSRYILSNLTANLQHHIQYNCDKRKYGTLLYRHETDIRPALSQALWKLRQVNHTNPNTETRQEQLESGQERTTWLHDLNNKIHSQAKHFLAKEGDHEYESLDIDQLIKEIDPELWETVCILTRSISEKRGTSRVTDESSQVFHIKKTRCFYLLCSLLFVTDDRCSLPMHTLLTDLVDSQGGSTLLIRVLNRLGICASLETLSRFIQHKVTTLNSTKQVTNGFTVISADNIDFLHSYARVFCGNQVSSWHGTSIQAAQPLPSLEEVETNLSSPHQGHPSLTPDPMLPMEDLHSGSLPTLPTDPMLPMHGRPALRLSSHATHGRPALRLSSHTTHGRPALRLSSQATHRPHATHGRPALRLSP